VIVERAGPGDRVLAGNTGRMGSAAEQVDLNKIYAVLKEFVLLVEI
jgi:hypothetical protein